MKNGELLEVHSVLSNIEQIYFDEKNTKQEVPKEIIGFILGNARIVGAVAKEKEEIEKDIQKIWKKQYKFDETKGEDKAYLEKANADFMKFRNSKANIKLLTDFIEKESKIELTKIESIEGCILPSAVLDYLEKYLVEPDIVEEFLNKD